MIIGYNKAIYKLKSWHILSPRKNQFVYNLNASYQRVVFLLFFFELFFAFPAICQENPEKDSICFCEYCRPKYEIGAEYFSPMQYTNEIKTITLDGFYWRKYFKKSDVLISVGVTANYAWGYSTQLYPLGDTAFLSVNYKTSAFGIGPIFQLAPTIVKVKRVSVIAEANGGILLYDKKFPYGGDYYNFMFRTGPSIVYQINHKYSMKIGARWLHVSNGKGSGNQNPYYDAIGLSFGILVVK